MIGVLLFFFFQAEDGIRDVAVTGVQTCALPILHWTSLVFDFQPAKDDSAGDHQRLEITACSVIDAGGPRFVLDAAENGRATERDLPPDGYTKFHAAEDNRSEEHTSELQSRLHLV